ncbi:hypothetical protein C8R45DRAFT_944792 [Mycena sanguinolenta]|nr:hypothetical protein C8R45DRAFT_944792 [Mycena sanguinolenta]
MSTSNTLLSSSLLWAVSTNRTSAPRLSEDLLEQQLANGGQLLNHIVATGASARETRRRRGARRPQCPPVERASPVNSPYPHSILKCQHLKHATTRYEIAIAGLADGWVPSGTSLVFWGEDFATELWVAAATQKVGLAGTVWVKAGAQTFDTSRVNVAIGHGNALRK